MARALLLTTIYIVVLSCCNSERRPFPRYSNYLHKAHPHHWNHDQEEFGRGVDEVAGGHQAEALRSRLPPLLSPHLEWGPWRSWTREALKPNLNKESRNIRKRLLEQKLKPNHPSRVIVHKDKNNILEANLHRMPRVKRDLTQTKDDFAERPEGPGAVRDKRQVLINPVLQPEVVMQPHMQAALHQSQETQNVQPNLNFHFYNPSIYYPEVIDALSNRSEAYQENVDQKRDKRHIFYLINKPAAVYTGPRATVNPFIREANTDDYEIVRPEPDYQGPGLGPSSDTDSYQLNEEAFEFSKVISDFYLATDNKNWPKIHQFAKTVLSPFVRLSEKRNKLRIQVKKDNTPYDKGLLKFGYKLYKLQRWEKMSHVVKQGRVKRSTEFQIPPELQNLRMQKQKNLRKKKKRKKRPPKLLGKALNRKRLKKRKQKERRFEAKRLRMRTHARRLRKQQKYKAARLERHYARMNLTTTAVPEYFGTLPAKNIGNLIGGSLINKRLEENHEYESEDNPKGSVSEDEDYDDDSSDADDYEESYEDDEDESTPDVGNLNYEYVEYDEDEEDDDDDENEYVSYENVTDEPVKNKHVIHEEKKRA